MGGCRRGGAGGCDLCARELAARAERAPHSAERLRVPRAGAAEAAAVEQFEAPAAGAGGSEAQRACVRKRVACVRRFLGRRGTV
jgi:hypothetical protein